jgi:predicted PolB exonuclease-like 3'-5' exonuclease
MNLFVFDIETVPDVESGRRLYGLDGLDDRNAAAAMFHLRAQETGGSEFLRHHLHRIVAISVVLRTAERFKVWSLGELEASEGELLRRFFDGIERFHRPWFPGTVRGSTCPSFTTAVCCTVFPHRATGTPAAMIATSNGITT